MMHIAFVIPAFPPNSTVEDFWSYGICQINQAGALAARGHQVTVIVRSVATAEHYREGVRYCFVNDGLPCVFSSWQTSVRLVDKLRRTVPDVVHLHSLSNPVLALRVRQSMPSKVAVFAEYHGEEPLKFPANILQRHVLRRLSGCIFANAEKAEGWKRRVGLSDLKIHQCIECAPDRNPGDKAAARRATGIDGHPVILWNSRAIRRRNPATVVAAFARYLATQSDTASHFYMMVPDHDPIVLQDIRDVMAKAPQLDGHFTLILERKPQDAMTPYYNSADYILSGSEDDPYGFGVVDAMSCGVVPVVPRSATFREITRDGEIGFLWDLRDPDTLVKQLIELPTAEEDIAELSAKTRAHFCSHHSMAAQGRTLEAIYLSAHPVRAS